MKVLIACQAGTGVGLGHLTRSLVIGKALRKNFNADVRYLIQGDLLKREDLSEFAHEFLAANEDMLGAMSKASSVDLVFLDLQPSRVPPGLINTIRSLRAAGAKVVAIDSLRGFSKDLDLVFVPSFQVDMVGMPRFGASVVFGWDCYLVDVLEERSVRSPGKRILALTGGSDATQLGLGWPSLLDQALPPGSVLDWVVGPFSAMPKLPKQPRITINKHIAPEGLVPLMRQADYAVTVFGVSFFELLSHGVPTVVFSPYGDKDDAELKGISEAGVALVAKDEEDATRKLVDVMSDQSLARRLSLRAKELLGVSGTERLCTEITKLLN